MASDFFRILRGLSIDESSEIMTGTGTPSGADQNIAPVGSLFLESDTATNQLNVWFKFQSTTSTVADWAQLASKGYVDTTAVSGITWKHPTVVAAPGTTSIPTGVSGNPIVINGVSVTNGQRVLFNSLTVNPNVYVYNETTGVFTVAPDLSTPAETGAATYVAGGTSEAGTTQLFNGTAWVLIDQADLTAISYLQTQVGVGNNSNMPVYSSTNFVTQGASTVAAISQLDTELGANVTSIAGSSIISPTNTINENIQSIAQNVANNSAEGSAMAVITSTQLDSFPARAIKYLLHVEQVGSTSNVRAYEVFVAHNGVSTDLTRYAVLTFGTAPVGFDVTASLTGGNTINLNVTSTTSVNVRWKRVSVLDVA